jgi:esterase/lipase superfamily enzyme
MNTRALKKLVLSVLCSFVLAACAGKPAAPPAPPAPPQPAQPSALAPQDWGRPVLYYATNRNAAAAGEIGARYGVQRSREMSYGQLLSTATGGQNDGSDQYRINVRLDRVTRMTRGYALSEIERAAARTPGREVLLFIHGFDNSFEDAAKTAVRIGVGIGFNGAAVLYSWPSLGSPTAYMADRNNAYWSVSGLKELLSDLTSSPWIGRVSVVVHSMGNEVFIRAYGQLANECASTRGGCADVRKVRAIVLAAPDMDRDVFLEQWAEKITRLGPRVVLYSSDADMALAASALVQGGDYERLGKNAPCIPGLHVTDVSDVKTDVLGHSWISQSRAVLKDLRCAVTEGCDRYAAGILREHACAANQRFAAPGVSATGGRPTTGQYYWKLVVPQGGNSAPASAGFNFTLPSFLSR